MYVLYGVLYMYSLYTVFVVSVVWPMLHDGMCCVYCVLCVWCDDVCWVSIVSCFAQRFWL